MYEKLGDLLNKALDNGEIPHEKNAETILEKSTAPHKEHIEKTEQKIKFIYKQRKIPVGQVIKQSEYIEPIQLPPEVINAIKILNVQPRITWFKIKMQYRKALKKYHPDTAQSESSITIDEIKNAFEILRKFHEEHFFQ